MNADLLVLAPAKGFDCVWLKYLYLGSNDDCFGCPRQGRISPEGNRSCSIPQSSNR